MIIETNANFNPQEFTEKYIETLQNFVNRSIGMNLKKAEKIHSETISKAVIFQVHLSLN